MKECTFCQDGKTGYKKQNIKRDGIPSLLG
jgi:hypothetical protein